MHFVAQDDTVEGSAWLTERQASGTSPEEKRAATLTLEHADTPSVAYLDTLGRTFLSVADNGPGIEHKYETRNELDLEGNVLSVTDALGIVTKTQRFDVAGRVTKNDGPDTGERVLFVDVEGKPRRAWDSREKCFSYEYDALQRPAKAFVKQGSADEQLVNLTVYGEGHAEAASRNLHGQEYAVFDSAGVATNERFDFKGNLLESSRSLALEFKTTPDWSSLRELSQVSEIENAVASLLNDQKFTTATAFDALNRPISITTPDESVTQPIYNEANLLEAMNEEKGVGVLHFPICAQPRKRLKTGKWKAPTLYPWARGFLPPL